MRGRSSVPPSAIPAFLQLTMTRITIRAEIAIAIAAFAFCYAGVFAVLIDQWATNPLFSYGFAVPLISGYIVSTKSAELRRLHRTPDYVLGVPAIFFGAAMLRVGDVGGLMMLQGASLVVTLAGLVLLLFGRVALSVVWFPITYLLLMLPIWDYPLNRLQVPSQTLSAGIAVSLLHSIGLPVLRQGTTIVMPTGTLEVMRECSGVNQLVAVTAMVIPAAYLWLHGHVRRIAFIGIAVVVAYLSNGLRIALVGLLTAKGLPGASEGVLHVLQGLVVSVLGYTLIGACLSLFARMGQKHQREVDGAETGVQPEARRAPAGRRHAWVMACVVGVMLLVGTSQLWSDGREVGLSEALHSLPNQIDEWTLDTAPHRSAVALPSFDAELVGAYPGQSGTRRFAAVDDELVRTYRSASGGRVQLYIGYYRRQEQGKELSGEAGHALQKAASELTLRLDSETIELNEIVQTNVRGQRGLLYWFDVNGRVLPSIYRAKGYTIWDALTRRRSNGAIIMIAWDDPVGANPSSARQGAIGFAEVLVPVLRQYLPS